MNKYYFQEYTHPTEGLQRTIVEPLDKTTVRHFAVSEDNPHYQEYLAWVAEGNTATEWDSDVLAEMPDVPDVSDFPWAVPTE